MFTGYFRCVEYDDHLHPYRNHYQNKRRKTAHQTSDDIVPMCARTGIPYMFEILSFVS